MILDQQDIDLIAATFPKDAKYVLKKESDTAVRCKSPYGGFSDDLDSDVRWEKFKSDIKRLFHSRVSEFYHHTCHRHTDFVIHFKKDVG